MTLSERFQVLYGSPPEVLASAPGRVNLIGEHTDYNDGFVLPLAVPLETRVALRRRGDRSIRVASRERDDGRSVGYALGSEQVTGTWIDYVQGVTVVLARAGAAFGGFEALLESDLPLGSGLGSSAALEVALLRALREAYGLQLSDLEIAQIGQRAETEFVGARIGIMDQLCASLGDTAHALFVDTRALTTQSVPIPPDLELLVIGSGVAHSNAAGEYNTRRAECEQACALLGVSSLRDVSPASLEVIERLPEPLSRRARHVVTENERVVAMIHTLAIGDCDSIRALMAASHRSMRDDYEVSVPEIDLLVDLAIAQPGVVGARLTGGGFGGSIVALALAGGAAEAGAAVVAEYVERTGQPGRVLLPNATPP